MSGTVQMPSQNPEKGPLFFTKSATLNRPFRTQEGSLSAASQYFTPTTSAYGYQSETFARLFRIRIKL